MKNCKCGRYVDENGLHAAPCAYQPGTDIVACICADMGATGPGQRHTRCAAHGHAHPAFEADNCPICGTSVDILGRGI